MIKWVRYSGLSININVNPFHWKWIPYLEQVTTSEWPGYVWEGQATWLFVRFRIWIDDGRW
jgi:hypothetical protein